MTCDSVAVGTTTWQTEASKAERALSTLGLFVRAPDDQQDRRGDSAPKESNMTIRKAEAMWTGSLREGAGELVLESGAFRGPYTFKARFEQGKETNPEELLGAAHAGCFTMALTALLAREKIAPTEIRTTASVHLEPVTGGFAIPKIELRTRAKSPGITAERFAELAADAKQNCPVSKALAGAEITLDAALD
jgi:osmotically inducible protein OsmC